MWIVFELLVKLSLLHTKNTDAEVVFEFKKIEIFLGENYTFMRNRFTACGAPMPLGGWI